MKVKTKISIGVILILLSLIGYLFYDNVGICWKPFNENYYKWFPYNPGDTLVFKSDNYEKKYVVTYYITQHNNTFMKYAKCGCCEEGISICLRSKTDLIDIQFDNFENSKSCMGEFLSIGKYNVQSYELKIQTKKEKNVMREIISIQNDTIVVTKNIGISSFILDNKIFNFQKIIKTNSEITKQSNYCD